MFSRDNTYEITEISSIQFFKKHKIHMEDRNPALIQLFWIFDSEKVGDHYFCY